MEVNYGIFAFEFQIPQLKWVKKEIKTNIQEQKRDNICVIDAEDLELDDILDTETTFNNLKQLIFESIETFKAAKLKTLNKTEIKALEFWKANTANAGIKKPAAPPGKSTPSSNPRCTIQNVKYKSSIANAISHLQNKNNYFVQEKIEDGPEFGVDLYIVLLGFSNVDIYFSILENNLNLMAIIYFYNLWEEADIENKVMALQNSDQTKNINISTQYIPSLSKYMANKYKKQISNEFCWYLYDLEHKRTEYDNYLNNLGELDVEDNKYPKHVFDTIKKLQIPNTAPDEIVVLIYLDNLFNLSCENSIESEDDNTEKLHDIYYINLNDQTLIFIHNDNNLLKLIYSSETINLNYDNIINFAKFSSLAYNIELFTNSITVSPYSEIDIFEFKLEDVDCFYLQQFNKEVFFQNVNALLRKFDKIIFSVLDENVLVFGQYINGLNSDCEKLFVIPNKLCFRDFCYYIAQNIENMIGNNNSSVIVSVDGYKKYEHLLSLNFIRFIALKNQEMEDSKISQSLIDTDGMNNSVKTENLTENLGDKVIVYNLSDTQQQITFTEYYYRSMCLSVSCYFDKWNDGKTFTRINTTVFENNIFYNRKHLDGQKNNAIRLIAKCGIQIYLSYQNVISECYNIFITWPNKVYIKAILSNDAIKELEQNSIKEYNNEAKRQFIDDGTLLIFYKNNIATILRPNGTIYCTNIITKTLEKECTQPSYLDYLYTKYEEEINYIKKYDNILDSKNFTITTTDGINFEVQNNIIKQKFQKFLINEWIDFLIAAIYVHREDDVKLVYTKEYLECNYPDGTSIKSYIVSRILFDFDNIEEFTDEDESYQIIRPILEVIINYIGGDGFTCFEFSYVTEHLNYAQTYTSQEDLKITNPEQVIIELKDGNINVELEDKVSLIYNSNNCTISSNNSIQDICNFKIKINFNETDKLLYDLNESGKIFEITRNNSCQLYGNEQFINNESGSITQSKILSFETYGGSKRSTVDEHTTELQTFQIQQNPHIYNNKEDGYECLIFPLKKYETIFNMPVDNVENLKLFEKSYFTFKEILKVTCPPIFISPTDAKDSSPIFTFNVFFKKCKENGTVDQYEIDDEDCECMKSLEDNEQYAVDDSKELSTKCKPKSPFGVNNQQNLFEENFSGNHTDINSLRYSMQNASGDDNVKFINFQDILNTAVVHLENECDVNEKKMFEEKQNALESKIMNYQLQKFGIRNLQKLVLCNVYPKYFDYVTETSGQNEDLVELYLKYRLPSK